MASRNRTGQSFPNRSMAATKVDSTSPATAFQRPRNASKPSIPLVLGRFNEPLLESEPRGGAADPVRGFGSEGIDEVMVTFLQQVRIPDRSPGKARIITAISSAKSELRRRGVGCPELQVFVPSYLGRGGIGWSISRGVGWRITGLVGILGSVGENGTNGTNGPRGASLQRTSRMIRYT